MIIVSDYEEYDKGDGITIIINSESCICPICHSAVSHRDWKRRIIKQDGGATQWLLIERRKCTNDGCGRLHNMLPDKLTPYKHYGAGLITAVLDGDIVPEDPVNEDLPCDETMWRWQHWSMANRLRIEGYCSPLLKDPPDGSATTDILRDSDSVTAYMHRLCGDKWLAAILRMIYNSGGFLVPSWA